MGNFFQRLNAKSLDSVRKKMEKFNNHGLSFSLKGLIFSSKRCRLAEKGQ
jgi:hypothetical protein